jgi:hypothetical protein
MTGISQSLTPHNIRSMPAVEDARDFFQLRRVCGERVIALLPFHDECLAVIEIGKAVPRTAPRVLSSCMGLDYNPDKDRQNQYQDSHGSSAININKHIPEGCSILGHCML